MWVWEVIAFDSREQRIFQRYRCHYEQQAQPKCSAEEQYNNNIGKNRHWSKNW